MIFVEFVFLPFFLVTFAVHWALPSHRARKAWLLAASYLFYGVWDWRFLTLLGFSTVLDYAAGRMLERPGARRKSWLLLSLAGNLGLLAYFKYFGFFVDSAVDFLRLLGFSPHAPTLGIILPVGISFYTFQTLSYTIDVYRGNLKATRSLLDFSLFVAFFPQLVAGPIVRASDLLPQLEGKKSLMRIDVRAALVLFLIGFFKKACVSDSLGPAVDQFYAAPEQYDVLSAWIAALCYTVQVYCDFSGYSDMAIACAALLGYELCLNFDRPLLACDITDFWRRWHISLSSWLRDYLYIPLGGNRRGTARTTFNLLATMVLCGLWHGAAWTFVVFGALHGLALTGSRLWRAWNPRSGPDSRLRQFLGWVATFTFFTITLIFFRSPDLGTAWIGVRGFALLGSGGTESLSLGYLVVVAGLGALHLLSALRGPEWMGIWQRLPLWSFCLGLGVVTELLLALVPASTRPFVYFQF